MAQVCGTFFHLNALIFSLAYHFCFIYVLLINLLIKIYLLKLNLLKFGVFVHIKFTQVAILRISQG